MTSPLGVPAAVLVVTVPLCITEGSVNGKPLNHQRIQRTVHGLLRHDPHERAIAAPFLPPPVRRSGARLAFDPPQGSVCECVCVLWGGGGFAIEVEGRTQVVTHAHTHTHSTQSVYSATIDSSTVMSSGFPPAAQQKKERGHDYVMLLTSLKSDWGHFASG